MNPQPVETTSAKSADTTRRATAQLINTSTPRSRLATFADQATQEILAVTYWFEPVERPEPYAVTIRFVGRRVGMVGKYQPGDQFIYDETIAAVVPGSGPIALTARISGVNPGEWLVTAHELGGAGAAGTPRSTRRERRLRQATIAPVAEPHGPLARFWHHWAPPASSMEATATPVRTSLAPFAHIAGTLPLIWITLVTLGMVAAVLFQWLIIAHDHLQAGPAFPLTLAAISGGIVGAKVWFVVKHWSDQRFDGWCIQGFITGATVTAVALLAVTRVSPGVFLDATVPGLLFGLAIGRVGCFFAGCCGGPPTACRWGVWSSDQHVGARRIPTQLMESGFALILALGSLVELLSHGTAGGAFFVGGLAAYTLGRQGILRLRAEQGKTQWVIPATALASAFVLVIAVAVLVQCHLHPVTSSRTAAVHLLCLL